MTRLMRFPRSTNAAFAYVNAFTAHVNVGFFLVAYEDMKARSEVDRNRSPNGRRSPA